MPADFATSAPLTSRFRGAALFGALFLAILALESAPGRLWPLPGGGPDTGFALALAWMMRRPDQLPSWLLGSLFLLADLVHGVPPGPGAALALAACEFLRPRAKALSALPFWARWLTVTALALARYPAEAFVLALLLVPHPSVSTYLVSGLFTALLWPPVAGLVHLFTQRRPGRQGS